MDEITENTEPEKKQLTVGEESLLWAEKYWHLDKECKGEHPFERGRESFNYEYFRKVFINAIDNNIAKRLSKQTGI